MNNMMQLEPAGRATPIDPAAATVATPHEARDTWRNVLVCTFRRCAVDRSDVLRVAHRAIDRRGIDRDLSPGAFLPASLTALAHRDGDLELGAAIGLDPRRAV